MRIFVLLALAAFLALPATAKTLLKNSQDNFAKACLDFEESSERIIEICTLALENGDQRGSQKLEIIQNLAKAHLYLDQLDQAEKFYLQILEVDSDFSAANIGMGWVLWEKNEDAAAVTYFEKALARHPSAEALGGLAASAFDAELIDFDTALAQLDASLAIDPEYRWSFRQKGWMLLDADQPIAAEESFRGALALSETDGNALFGMARSLRKQDRHKEALETINAALNGSPDNVGFLGERSLITFALGYNKLAVKDAERVIKLAPEWTGGYVRKGRAMAELGQREKAIAMLVAAEAELGLDSYLSYWIADLMVDEGRLSDAVTQLQRLVDKGVSDSFDLHLMAYSQLELGDFQAARKTVEQVRKLAPEDAYTHYYDARVLIEEGAYDLASEQMLASVKAGIPEFQIKAFLSAFARKGEFVRMIKLRVEFSEITKK